MLLMPVEEQLLEDRAEVGIVRERLGKLGLPARELSISAQKLADRTTGARRTTA
jgi:hypothetical protein